LRTFARGQSRGQLLCAFLHGFFSFVGLDVFLDGFGQLGIALIGQIGSGRFLAIGVVLGIQAVIGQRLNQFFEDFGLLAFGVGPF